MSTSSEAVFFDAQDLVSVSNASVQLHRPTIHGPPEPFALEPLRWGAVRAREHAEVDRAVGGEATRRHGASQA